MVIIIMGRREQRERQRKRAASTCQSLEKFLPRKKKESDSSTNSELSERQRCETVESVSSADGASSNASQPSDQFQSSSHESCSLVAVSEPETDSDDVSDNQVQPIATCSAATTCTFVEGNGAGSSESAAAAAADDHDNDDTGCELPIDIGEIYTKSETVSEFCKAMHTLNSAQKYSLLTNHRKPRLDHVFPTTYLGGCNRSFRHVWLAEHPWLVYSEVVDGAFCSVCSVFCADTSKGNLVVQPFRLWHKKGEKFKVHEHSAYHQHALQQADLLKQSVEKPHTAIAAQLDTRKAANIQRNRTVLKSIARAVLYCGSALLFVEAVKIWIHLVIQVIFLL